MKTLEEKHPQSYVHLQNGGLVVRRCNDYNFNAVSTDQALEQTINRETKGQGGVIGLTLRKQALTRWLMTRHETAEFADALKTLCQDRSSKNRTHEELQKSRIVRDEADVQKVVDIINHNQNPFDLSTVPEKLTNIVIGQVASAEVQKSLIGFLNTGVQKQANFMTSRLLETKSKNFWDAEPRFKLVTFVEIKKPVTVDPTKKMIVSSEVLFRRLLAVSKQRDVDLHSVMKYELSAVPPALFHDDGQMRKTTKSELAKRIESTVRDYVRWSSKWWLSSITS